MFKLPSAIGYGAHMKISVFGLVTFLRDFIFNLPRHSFHISSFHSICGGDSPVKFSGQVDDVSRLALLGEIHQLERTWMARRALLCSLPQRTEVLDECWMTSHMRCTALTPEHAEIDYLKRKSPFNNEGSSYLAVHS